MITKIAPVLIAILIFTACEGKKEEKIIPQKETKVEEKFPAAKNKESIEGIYVSNECDLFVEISKTKDGFAYFLKTSVRELKGKANFTKTQSGENYLVLEGIQWDEYEGDISNENDSTSSKEIEIPVGIGASYVKDTLTIQNYGNAMNSYTKISECGSKFIQLIKK